MEGRLEKPSESRVVQFQAAGAVVVQLGEAALEAEERRHRERDLRRIVRPLRKRRRGIAAPDQRDAQAERAVVVVEAGDLEV